MKQEIFNKIVFCICLLISLAGKSQDSIQPKESKQQAGFDIYFLSCGDTAGDFYLGNYDFSILKNTEWKATSLGFSFHWFYKLKRCSAGLRAGLINDASLYHGWEDLNGSSPRNQDRTLVIRHSKIFISPTIKFEKKIKWLTAGFSAELPIMFADKIRAQGDYSYTYYSAEAKDTVTQQWNETWKETIKNGPSFGFGAGVFGNVMISKKIKMELALNEYYFFIRCKQKTERNGSYDGKVMNSPGNYNLYNGEYSYKKENDLRSASWSKLSVRLSFSYCF